MEPGELPSPSSPLLADADLVLYFGPTDRITDPVVHRSIGACFPAAVIVGASAGSQVSGGRVDDDSLVIAALRFDATTVVGVSETIADAEQSLACGRRLATALAGDRLAAVLVLSDGLNVNGSRLVEGLRTVLGEDFPVSGGLAGDGPRFGRTAVGLNECPRAGVVAAIGLYGEALRISHAAAGGWESFGPQRIVTRSHGNVLHELDGQPALDLYERYLGEEAEGLPVTALLYPLKIWDRAAPESRLVRTVLSVDKSARTMTFAGDIPQGSCAQLMRGVHPGLIDGARRVAGLALEQLPLDTQGDRLALLISCVGRRQLMGQRTADEVSAICSALGTEIPTIGFYSYGEIAPHSRTGRCEFHNQTMTVTLLAESAMSRRAA